MNNADSDAIVAAKPPKKIAVWGEIVRIERDEEEKPVMHKLVLKDKPFTISVMKAYVVGFDPQVGGYAVKYEDRSLGYLSREEFNKMKEEGNHGI
jgi:regulation of enolase protein 1 (concanavalin A-like superfamily)